MNALVTAQPAKLQQAHRQFNEKIVGRFVDWLGVRGLSHNTQLTYGRATREFSAFLGGRSILATEHAEILQYLTRLYDAGLSKQTVFVYVEALRCLQRFISLAGLPNNGALGRIAVPKIPTRIGGYHTLQEVETMIEAAKTCRERALLEFAFATACRASEIIGIRVEHIDFENRSIKVLGKGNKERVVPFGEPAALALRYHLGGRTEGLVFPIGREHLGKIFRAVGRRVGIKTHPHMWRHSAATALLNGGMDLRYLQGFLGHVCINTTARYLHSTTADLVKTHSKFHPHGSGEAK